MRKFFAGLVFILAAVTLHAQKASIKGTVTDTVEKKNLSNAVIAILKKPDSVLVKFSRANKDGDFLIRDLDTGRFILMATHPFFGDYFDEVEVKENSLKDLATIYLTPHTKL